MPVPPPSSGYFHLRWFPVPVALLLLASGCRKAEIKSYTAPKDEPEEQAPKNDELANALPKLTWTLPEDWKELGADKMSAARFSLPGDAQVMITPLALMAGQEPSLVNMWRQMMGQPLLSEEEAGKAFTDVSFSDGKGKLFAVTGKSEGRDISVVTAFQHRDDRSWFFKLQGPPDAVSAQQPAFVEFLKSVKFDAAATPPAPLAPSSSPPSTDVPGTPPAEWTAAAAGARQAAKFSVPEKDGAKADVTVSIFPSDTGGALANVRRWRGQLGMADADDAAITALVKPLPGAPEGTITVDLENEGRSLTGAVIPRGGRWYFYKLMGGTAAVAAAKEAFITYCKAGS